MNESKLRLFPLVVGVITSLCFALFTAYQIMLFVQIDNARFGRLLGITCFTLITLGSIWGLFRINILRYMRVSLLTSGFTLIFIIKLINIPRLFGDMGTYNAHALLYLAIFVASGAGVLIAMAYFFMIRFRLRSRDRRTTNVMLPVIIVLFAVSLVADGLLILRLGQPSSVLNCVVYIFSQAALLVLIIYYLTVRHQQSMEKERAQTFMLMPLVILLYLSCLTLECVLIFKYDANIEQDNLIFTVISRFLYYFGFMGTALRFMLVSPRPRKSRSNKAHSETK